MQFYLEMFERFGEHFVSVIEESIEFQRERLDDNVLKGMQKAIHLIREEVKFQQFKHVFANLIVDRLLVL